MTPAGHADNIDLRSDPATREILDTADGIDRVMGDRDLYARMLRRFRADYGGGVARIRNALHGGDRNLAHRIAHTLKGASGMIGAHQVNRRANELEVSLRVGSGNGEAEVVALEVELDRLMRLLDKLLDVHSAIAPRALGSHADLLADLIHLLANGDGAAIDQLEGAATSLKAILGEDKFAQVLQRACAFDFDGALALLEGS